MSKDHRTSIPSRASSEGAKARRRVVGAKDPSELLYKDPPIPAHYRLREPLKNLALDGLSWPCALAWVCAREAKLVEKLDEACRRQALDISSALALLEARLADRFQRPADEASRAVSLATQQMFGLLLSASIVRASGRQVDGSERTLIDPDAWFYFAATGSTPFDAFYDIDKEAITFVDVKIDAAAVLRRWSERPLARLTSISGETWNLPETLYWYARATHKGYEGERSLGRDEWARAQDKLMADLRTRKLSCRASLRAGTPGAGEADLQVRDHDWQFWDTFSIGESAEAEFGIDRVIKAVPPALDLSGFSSREAAASYIHEVTKIPFKRARQMARDHVPRGKSGPKPTADAARKISTREKAQVRET